MRSATWQVAVSTPPGVYGFTVGGVIPVTQATAGWLLVLAACGVLVIGLGLRGVARRPQFAAAWQRIIGRFGGSALSQWLISEVGGDASPEKQLEGVVLLVTIVVSFALLAGAVFLLGFDAIGTELTYFRQP